MQTIPQQLLFYGIQIISQHEGFRSIAYQDTVGVWTIGFGFTSGVVKGMSMTLAQAQARLVPEIQTAYNDAQRVWPSYLSFDMIRQLALLDMAYNLGAGHLGQFINTNRLINNQIWVSASKNLLLSLWAKQVGHRAIDDATALSTGKWPWALTPYSPS